MNVERDKCFRSKVHVYYVDFISQLERELESL